MPIVTNLRLKSLRGLSNLSDLSFLSYLKKLRFSRKVVVVIVAVALVATTFPLAAFLTAKPAKAAWYNDDWHYRKSILFTHSGAESNIYLNLSGANALDTSASGRYQSDCGDLRFTDGNGNLLSYFLVSGCGTATTVVHVLYGTMPAGDQYLYVYYGNSTVANGTTSFDFSTAATGITFGSVGSEETSQVPVAEWKFDEGYGASTKDSSTNGNNGTLTNGPTWQDPSMCVSGKCLQFNGTNSYVVSTTNIQCSLEQSVSGWYRAYSTGGSRTVFELAGCGGRFLLYANNNLSFYADSVGNIATSTNYTDGQWHFFTVTTTQINGTQITANIYADGKLAKSSAVTFTSPGSPGKLYVGSVSPGNANFFKGNIDDIALYNYARSASQIQQDYASGLTSLNQQQGNLGNGLVSYWKMDEASWNGTAGEVLDSSGAGNNGTAACVGTCTDPTTAAGKFGNAGSFDGVDDYVNTGTVDLTPNGGFTEAGWFKLNATGGTQHILGGTANGSLPNIADLYVFGSSIHADNEGATNQCISNMTLSAGTWYFVAYTNTGALNNSKSRKIYINGVDTTSTCVAITQAVTARIQGIGYDGYTVHGYNFNGLIDEIRGYTRVLSSSEIQQLYNYGPRPVAAYNFEEGSGTTVNDVTGNGNTGTWSGTGNHWTPGKIGIAGNLNGTDDTVTIANNSALNFDYNQDFSVGFWVKDGGGNASTANTILEKWGGSGAFPYSFRADTNSTCFRRYDGTNTGMACDANIVLTDHSWHYVMGTKTGSTLSIYVDGQLEGTGTDSTTTTTTNTSSLYFGSRAGSSLYYKGSLDQIRIYNYGRSQTQMLQDMNGSVSALDSPVGWWKMDENQGTTVNNSGGGGSSINGTTTSTTWTTSGKYGSALSFNGSSSLVSMGNPTALKYTGPFSLSAWIKPSASSGEIMGKYDAGNNNRSYRLYLSSGKLQLSASSDGITPTSATGHTTLTTDGSKWYHVAGVYDGAALRVYINGVQDGSAAYSSAVFSGSTNFAVGADYSSTVAADFMTGTVDEVKAWASALTSLDILADYNRTGGQKVGSAGAENVTTKSGATSTQPSNSKNSEYCVPGDTSSCAGPLAYYNFEEGSGNNFNDITGNGFGANSNQTPRVVGKYGMGISIQPYVNLLKSTATTSPPNTITMSAWVKPGSLGGNITGFDGSAYILGLNTSGGIYFRVYDGTTYTDVNSSNVLTSTDLNKWSYVSVTYDDSNVRFYLNGALVSTSAVTRLPLSTAAKICIGYCGNGYFNGGIDEVRLYNYVRTPAQIAWDYNHGGPVAWYKMDECSGSTVHSSTNPYNAALNGTITIGGTGTQTAVGTCLASGTAWGNGASGKRGASLNFDGTDDYIGINSSNQLNFGTSSDFTLSAWVKASSVANQPFIIDNRNTYGGTNAGYTLLVDASGRPGLRLGDGTNVAGYGPSSGTYATGVWHHYAVSVSRTGTTYFYADGKKIGSANVSAIGNITTANTLHIGTKDGTATNGINGQIDDVQVFNYVLTPTQISTLYNGGSVYWGQ